MSWAGEELFSEAGACTPELSLTEGGTQLGVASMLSPVACDHPAPTWSCPECQTSGGFGPALASRVLGLAPCRGDAQASMWHPISLPFCLSRVSTWLAEASQAGGHCPSLGSAPTPNWHPHKSRAPTSPATSPPRGRNRVLCAVFSAERLG